MRKVEGTGRGGVQSRDPQRDAWREARTETRFSSPCPQTHARLSHACQASIQPKTHRGNSGAPARWTLGCGRAGRPVTAGGADGAAEPAGRVTSGATTQGDERQKDPSRKHLIGVPFQRGHAAALRAPVSPWNMRRGAVHRRWSSASSPAGLSPCAGGGAGSQPQPRPIQPWLYRVRITRPNGPGK